MEQKYFSLFEVAGIELEYMIVDRQTLAVKPIADKLLFTKSGDYSGDAPNGIIAWSNELVNHVIELKTNEPAASLNNLEKHFSENIREINQRLEAFDAMLLPGAAHPLMNPFTETMLWQHENNEIYALMNSIFDCRGHGWSNLQSTHLNLPFHGDTEFEKLHAAIRVILPVIPALCASSPILDGKFTGLKDARMKTYLHNQEKIPSLTGKLIPEAVFSQQDYTQVILNNIQKDMQPLDKNNITKSEFMNSRGAIARFGRGSIEIRVIDVQECPLADVAVTAFIIETLKNLINETWCDLALMKSWHEDDLLEIFKDVITDAEETMLRNIDYLRVFGIKDTAVKAGELWRHLFSAVENKLSREHAATINHMLNRGTLSTRILNQLNQDFRKENILDVYRQLAFCLQKNELFE